MSHETEKRISVLIVCAALFAFGVSALFAAAWVGFLFGWIIGKSESPISATVAPLVFGLLAVAGFGFGLKRSFASTREILRGAFVAVGVCVFCSMCQWGIAKGIESRTLPYKGMHAVLGPSWSNADRSVALAAFRLRRIAQQQGVSRSDFDDLMVKVLKPVLDDESSGQEYVLQVIADIERTFARLPDKGTASPEIAVPPPTN